MARELTNLPKTRFSGLDYDNLITDITNLVKDNPDFNTNWDDFLSSDAGRMLVELFSYIADQLATRIDWVVNENWIGTATQKRSVMRILKLIGYNFSLPVASEIRVDFDMSGDTWHGNFYLTDPYDASEGTFSPYSLTAADRTGASKNYELLPYSSTNEKYDYKTGVLIDDPNKTLYFYEGSTYVENFTAQTDNAPSFTLAQSSVINKSIRIYFVDDNGGNPIETELLEVDSFLDPLAQKEEYDDGTEVPIPYVLTVNEDETVTIDFGATGILSSSRRRLAIGDVIKVFYRSGGGIAGNLTTQSINETRNLTISPVASPSSSYVIHPSFINPIEGTMGQDGETADHASTYAPLQIRTANKAVSADDYDILLNSKVGILTAKVYGAQNAPEELFDKYRIYINPLDAWCYAVPDAAGWRTANSSDYNKMQWIGLRSQNMFNEISRFTSGAFNYSGTHTVASLSGDTIGGKLINLNGLGDTKFYNFLTINTPQELKDGFKGNTNFRLKLSVGGDSSRQFKNIANLVFGDSLYIRSGDTRLRTSINTNATYTSLINIETPLDMTTRKKIKMNIDNLGDTVINLVPTDGDSTSVYPYEIARKINKHFNNLHNYYSATDVRTYFNGSGYSSPVSFSILETLLWNNYLIVVGHGSNPGKTFMAASCNLTTHRWKYPDGTGTGDGIFYMGDSVLGGGGVWNISTNYGENAIIHGDTLILVANASNKLHIASCNLYNNAWRTFDGLGTGPNVWGDTQILKSSNSVVLHGDTLIFVGIGATDKAGIGSMNLQTRGIRKSDGTTIGSNPPTIRGDSYFGNTSSHNIGGWAFVHGDTLVVVGTGDGIVYSATISNNAWRNITGGGAGPNIYHYGSMVLEVGDSGGNNDHSNVMKYGSTIIVFDMNYVEAGTPLRVGSLKLTNNSWRAYDGATGGSTPPIISFNESGDSYAQWTSYGILRGDTLVVMCDGGILSANLITNGWKYIDGTVTGSNPPNIYKKHSDLGDTYQSYKIDRSGIKSSQGDTIFGAGNSSFWWASSYYLNTNTLIKYDQPSPYGSTTGLTGVASIYEPNASVSYLRITSQKSGDSSIVSFQATLGDSDAVRDLFGSHLVAGDTYAARGKVRMSLVSNSAETNYFGKVILEVGANNLLSDPKEYFVHYLLSSGDTVAIGTYANSNYIQGIDPEWREIAQRVYNTYTPSGDSIPNIYLSDFQLRFTKAATGEVSLYNIDSDWNLTKAVVPTFTGDSIIGAGDTILGLNASNYRLLVNVDGLGDTVVDVTGDSGASALYSVTQILNNINTKLRAYYSLGGEPYDTFEYAIRAGRRIYLKSPTYNNESYFKIKPTISSASREILGPTLGDSGDSKIRYITGDYYVKYNSVEDRMDLVKVNVPNNASNMPDTDFYTHFIWDRRLDETDEDDFQTFLEDTKIIGLNNVFKQPTFSTFDASGQVYYDPTYSFGTVKTAVENAITEEYSLLNSADALNRDFGVAVNKSSFLKLIHDIPGVDRVVLTYFGKDATTPSTNEDNTIDCEFDEIIVLSNTGGGHGIVFTYIESTTS